MFTRSGAMPTVVSSEEIFISHFLSSSPARLTVPANSRLVIHVALKI
jgi:hypothetical protein